MCEQTDSHRCASRAELRGKLGAPVLAAAAITTVSAGELGRSRSRSSSGSRVVPFATRQSVGGGVGQRHDARQQAWMGDSGLLPWCRLRCRKAQGRGSRVAGRRSQVAGSQNALVVLSQKVPMTRNWMLWLKRWGAG